MKGYRYENRILERACPWILTKEFSDGRGCEVPTDREGGLALAQAQWESVRRDQIPGLAISPYPQLFMIQSDNFPIEEGAEPGWLPVYFVDSEAILEGWIRDDGFRGDFLCHSYFRKEPLENWRYMTAAANCGATASLPDTKDLPNPRAYWLDGTLAIGWNDDLPIGPWLLRVFQDHVMCIWNDGLNINHRNDRLTLLLDHHHNKGGDPEKFIAYIGDLIAAPPKGFDALLVAKLKAWCVLAAMQPVLGIEAPVLEDLVGAARMSKLIQAMKEEGYLDSYGKPNRKGRGKSVYAASVHAALDKFGVKMPLAKLWPAMLDGAFPGLDAGEKLRPTLKPAQRTAEYKEAFANITAHLS